MGNGVKELHCGGALSAGTIGTPLWQSFECRNYIGNLWNLLVQLFELSVPMPITQKLTNTDRHFSICVQCCFDHFQSFLVQSRKGSWKDNFCSAYSCAPGCRYSLSVCVISCSPFGGRSVCCVCCLVQLPPRAKVFLAAWESAQPLASLTAWVRC